MKEGLPPAVALVADPDPATSRTLSALLEGLGLKVVGASTAAEALEKFSATAPSLVLMDSNLPDIPGFHLIPYLRDTGGQIPVIVLGRQSDLRTAIEATRHGAADYLDKLAAPSQLLEAIERHVVRRGEPAADTGGPRIWDRPLNPFLKQYGPHFRWSEGMRRVETLLRRVADTNATVLIQGETGVGKELVAKAIHYLSRRAAKPWLKVSCASLPSELLESELFGHERGAFTGALVQKPGRFELAHGGTLLLDEIGEMPLALQSKLLHVLQDNEFFRVGGRELISTDTRVIAATNRDIHAMVGSGTFRRDLYYRLNVVNIVVPPLRERRAEIPYLSDYFLKRFSQQLNRRAPELSPELISRFHAYSWPGNVRELENLMRRFVVLGDEEDLRGELDRRFDVPEPSRGPVAAPGVTPGPARARGLTLREIARRAACEAESAAIREVLEQAQWNRAEAARLLKTSYKTLLQKLRQNGIGPKPRAKGKG